MKDQKNIERLFQEKFKDFEATPPQGSWNAIASRLNEKKKKKRVVPFWFQLSGIAASLFIIGTLIWNFQSEKNTSPFNNTDETVVGVENENNESQNSNLNSQGNSILNTNTNNQNVSVEENTNTSESKNSKFDSNLINSKKSNTSVVSNENKNIRSNEKNTKTNRSIISDTKKNKKRIQYNNNANESNSIIVANSKKSKGKRNKSANETLISNDDILLANGKNNNTSNWVVTKNLKNKSNQNEKINVDKIDSFFDENQTVTNYVNAINDTNKKSTDTTNVIVASLESIINNDSTLVAIISPEINPLEELLKEKEAGKNEDEKEKEKGSKWAISTNASPVYFNSLAQGSSIDADFSTNQKSFNNTVSYGLGVNYAVNKKLSIKTGINSLKIDYNTNDIAFYQTAIAKPLDNLVVNKMGQMINVESKLQDNGNYISPSGSPLIKYDGVLNQVIGFIEVPVELSYKVIDNNKFDIEVVGGMSTLFLSDNSVSIVSNGQEMTIGKANNLNNIHFSSNVGLGFKYSFWKNFDANFQPMFKYQINTFSENSGDFKPYFIGLYTGVSFSF